MSSPDQSQKEKEESKPVRNNVNKSATILRIQKENLERQKEPNNSMSCFQVFTILNIFITICLGCACLTLNPDIQDFSQQIFYLVVFYNGIDIICFFIAMFVMVFCSSLKVLFPDQQINCNMGWFPIIYYNSLYLAYLFFLPLGGWEIYSHFRDMPQIVLLDLSYIWIVSAYYIFKLITFVINNDFISSHMIEMQHNTVHETKQQDIEKFQNQMIEDRNQLYQK